MDDGVISGSLVSYMSRIRTKLQNVSLHCMYSLGRYCIAPRMDYIAQHCYPTNALSALRRFDVAALSFVATALGADPRQVFDSNGIVLQRLRLPARSGGGGIRSCADLSPAAFVGTAAQALPHLVDLRDPTGNELHRWHHLLASGCRLGRALETAWDGLRADLRTTLASHGGAGSGDPANVHLVDGPLSHEFVSMGVLVDPTISTPVLIPQLQRALTSQRETARATALQRLAATLPITEALRVAALASICRATTRVFPLGAGFRGGQLAFVSTSGGKDLDREKIREEIFAKEQERKELQVREEIDAKEQELKEFIAKFEAAKDSDEKQFYSERIDKLDSSLAKLQDTLKGLRLAPPHQSEGWKRREDLDRFAAEIIELHGMCCALEENFDAEIGGEVQHAGYGVLVQKPSIAIDYDSVKSKINAVITRKEQRSVARHAIDATESSKDVIVVGDPGIGKTRGSMFFAMQELLAKNKTVMRVGFKESKIILFKPGAQGKYEVWVRSDASTWLGTDVANDPEAFVLIDPPEKRPYPDMAECRTIKFASNNAEQHYPNAQTAPEETFDTLKSKEDEIMRRALLVGCAPRVQAVASVHELARLALHTLVVKKLKCAQQVYHSSEFGHMFERDVCTFVLSVLPANWKPGSALDALELRRTVIKSDESPKS
ncbi:hypothetical protein CTAYLR_007532, partial [Chrysophaeum taylorii]